MQEAATALRKLNGLASVSLDRQEGPESSPDSLKPRQSPWKALQRPEVRKELHVGEIQKYPGISEGAIHDLISGRQELDACWRVCMGIERTFSENTCVASEEEF